MENMNMIFSNEIKLEDNRNMKLEYNLTESFSEENKEIPYYGIQITKYVDGTVETENVKGISFSKEKVVAMIKILFQYEVTPISMIDIIDDMITLEN